MFAGIDITSERHWLARSDDDGKPIGKPVPITEDRDGYDRMLARQGAAAEHVLAAFEHGEEPAAADLADIGVDTHTALADTALIQRVRAFVDPHARASTAQRMLVPSMSHP